MWGYIVAWHSHYGPGTLPSLYVRVYRARPCCQSLTASSLTVCDGVSSCEKFKTFLYYFPNCMWGYITKEAPPSFRVISSLTVCEGVSILQTLQDLWNRFPHCVWGCIARYRVFFPILQLPPLCVRVYLFLNSPHCTAGTSPTTSLAAVFPPVDN